MDILELLVKYTVSPLLALALSTLLTFVFRKQLKKIIHEAISESVASGVENGFRLLWGEAYGKAQRDESKGEGEETNAGTHERGKGEEKGGIANGKAKGGNSERLSTEVANKKEVN